MANINRTAELDVEVSDMPGKLDKVADGKQNANFVSYQSCRTSGQIGNSVHHCGLIFSRNLSALRFGIFFFLLLILQTHFALAEPESLDLTIREWVAENIYFENNQLLIRDKPIRAFVGGISDPKFATEARRAVVNLAAAYGLSVEFPTTGVNLVVVAADRIAVNGRPDLSLLTSLGVSEAAASTVIENSHDWSNGCGVYDSRDKDNHVTASIVAADRKVLSAGVLQTCVITGIVYSFGLHVRGGAEIKSSNDYIQFLFLARAVGDCKRQFNVEKAGSRAPSPDVYMECIAGKLKEKLSS